MIENCPTAEQILEDVEKHPKVRCCPRCEHDVASMALTGLVYVFEPCNCGVVIYTHLIQRVYHRGCFLNANKTD